MTGENRPTGYSPQTETALDQGVITYYEADARENGAWHQSPLAEPAVPPAPAPPLYRPARRGAGDYPVDYPHPERFMPLTEEEVAARKAVLEGDGHQAALEVARQAASRALTKTIDGNSSWAAARLRARQERLNRPH